MLFTTENFSQRVFSSQKMVGDAGLLLEACFHLTYILFSSHRQCFHQSDFLLKLSGFLMLLIKFTPLDKGFMLINIFERDAVIPYPYDS